MAVRKIIKILKPSDGTNVVEITANEAQDSKITMLRATVNVPSHPLTDLPDSELGESRSERSMRFLENERLANRVEIELVERLAPTEPWIAISRFNAINRGIPYYPSLLRGIINLNGEYELQAGNQLGIRQRDIGYGLLAVNDSIVVHGMQVVGVDELSAPIIVNIQMGDTQPTVNVPIDYSPTHAITIPVDPIAIPIAMTMNVDCNSDGSTPTPTPTGAWLSRTGWIASANANNAQSGLAIDGDTSTFWTTNAFQTPDQWWQVDLGSQRSVSQIDITELSGDKGLGDIQGSLDGSTFTAIQVNAIFNGLYIFTATNLRYLRLQSRQSAGAYWRLSDVRVYGV